MTAAAGPRPLWRLLFWCALAGSLVLALVPNGPEPMGFEHADKLKHAAGFAVLYVLGWAAGIGGRTLWVGLVLFGIGIEAAQGLLTETRQPSLGDVAADVVGVALGWLVVAGWQSLAWRASDERAG